MTVSKTTTQEKARPAITYCSTCAKCGGETYWHGDTWYHESGRDVMKCGVAEPQTPPDSLTAELQKENARLREALENISALKAGPCRGFNLERCETCIAREALGQVRKP